MKAGLLRSPGHLELAEVPRPTPGRGEIVVRLAACGVCGTDLEKLRGNYQTAGKIGHEPVGIVDAIGEGVTSSSLGDRVFVHHHVPCYSCAICQRGDYTFCPSYSNSNIDPGGFAEWFRVPEENVRKGAVLPLGPSVSWEEGALLEPAGCALTALRRVGFHAGDSVFVVGLGPVGLLYARLAHALGAGWIGGAELSPLRREAAERGGVDLAVDPQDADGVRRKVRAATGDRGVDLAVVATGAPPAVGLAASLPRRGGTLNLFGLPESGSRLDVDLQQLYLRGVRVLPTYATTERDLSDVHALLTSGRLHVRDIVTHRIPIERIAEAFDLARRPESALKVVVTGPALPDAA
ncbi:MAG: alcohol dehydrogenase catalytic domain-containing protein [Thermoplasmata archaeon]|nr:alcohol dehydrogenase catalytic domain-containing protein [Thermoplasmata archaeon]